MNIGHIDNQNKYSRRYSNNNIPESVGINMYTLRFA